MGNILSSCSGRSEIDDYDDRAPRRRGDDRRRRRSPSCSCSRSRSRGASHRESSRRDRGSGHGSGSRRQAHRGRDRERSRSDSRDRGHDRDRSRELDTYRPSNRNRGSRRSNSSNDSLYDDLGGDIIIGTCGRRIRYPDGTRYEIEQDFMTDGRNTYRVNTPRVSSSRGPLGYGFGYRPAYFSGSDPYDRVYNAIFGSRSGGGGSRAGGGGGGSGSGRSDRDRDRDIPIYSDSGSDTQVPAAGDGHNRLLGYYPRGRIFDNDGGDR